MSRKRGELSKKYYLRKVREIMGRGVFSDIIDMSRPSISREDAIEFVRKVLPKRSKYNTKYHRSKLFDAIQDAAKEYALLSRNDEKQMANESDEDYDVRISRLEELQNTYSLEEDKYEENDRLYSSSNNRYVGIINDEYSDDISDLIKSSEGKLPFEAYKTLSELSKNKNYDRLKIVIIYGRGSRSVQDYRKWQFADAYSDMKGVIESGDIYYEYFSMSENTFYMVIDKTGS